MDWSDHLPCWTIAEGQINVLVRNSALSGAFHLTCTVNSTMSDMYEICYMYICCHGYNQITFLMNKLYDETWPNMLKHRILGKGSICSHIECATCK